MSLQQMTDIYGVPCDVHEVRRFSNDRRLGAGYDLRDPATWFVYDRESAEAKWHKHCGYTRISFIEREPFLEAVKEYHKRQRTV